MASSSGSSPWTSGELVLAASRASGRRVAVTGHVVAELPAANTPRHGLAIATVAGTSYVAASHVCPATGAASIRLISGAHRRRPASSRSPSRGAHRGGAVRPYLLAGGVSGHVYALALPSGHVTRSFRAHGGGGGVSCLTINDDGSFLVSSGDDGGLAAFLLLDVLDVEAAGSSASTADLAVYRVAAEHAAPVTCVACGAHGGCNAVVASASADGTCKVWRLADGSHLRTLGLPCCSAALSLALDPTSTNLYAGGSDGRVHVASLNNSPATNTSSSHAGAAAAIGVAVTNGGKSLVSCSEDGEVRVWDLTAHGGLLLHASTFWLRGAVSGVLVVKKHSGEVVASSKGGGEGFRIRDDVSWTRACEVVEMEEMLRSSEDRASSVALLETNLDIYKRCLRLMRREVIAVANGGRCDGKVSD